MTYADVCNDFANNVLSIAKHDRLLDGRPFGYRKPLFVAFNGAVYCAGAVATEYEEMWDQDPVAAIRNGYDRDGYVEKFVEEVASSVEREIWNSLINDNVVWFRKANAEPVLSYTLDDAELAALNDHQMAIKKEWDEFWARHR